MTYLGDLREWQEQAERAKGNKRWKARCVDRCGYDGRRIAKSVQEAIQMGPCPRCGAPVVVE